MKRFECKDYLEISARSIAAFANDGILDIHEFDELLGIALREDVVDENEKRVLSNIIDRLTDRELTPQLRNRITEVRTAYAF